VLKNHHIIVDYRTFVLYNIQFGTFNKLSGAELLMKGGDIVNKKDMLISALVIIIFLLLLLLFAVLI